MKRNISEVIMNWCAKWNVAYRKTNKPYEALFDLTDDVSKLIQEAYEDAARIADEHAQMSNLHGYGNAGYAKMIEDAIMQRAKEVIGE